MNTKKKKIADLSLDKEGLSDGEILKLFTSHQADMVNYACRITKDYHQSEDISQEAYLRFHAKMQEGFNDKKNVRGYLHRIVRNMAIDFSRRTKYEMDLFPEDVLSVQDLIPENKSSLEDAAIASEEFLRVLKGLESLPERTRLALEMNRLGGYTMREIGAHLGVSKSLATNLVARAVVVCRRYRFSELPLKPS